MAHRRSVLGQLGLDPGMLTAISSLISAGAQAGASVYGANMQEKIAKIQQQTQQQANAAQSTAASQQAQAQTQAAQTQLQTAQIQAKSGQTILGLPSNTVMLVGVGLAVALGVGAIVMIKSGAAQSILPAAFTPSKKPGKKT